MASSPDTLIANAELRALAFSSAVDTLVTELRTFVHDYEPWTVAPSTLSLNLTDVALPAYAAPAPETSPLPVYEPPNALLPTAPQLADVATIDTPNFPTAPTITTTGLFAQVAPSANIPDWNNSEPDLRVDALVAEMDALTAPVLAELEFPEIAALNLGPAPTLTLPGYDAPPPPDALRDPTDYAAALEAKYHAMLPSMQAFIDDKVSGWISAYAPEYEAVRGQLADKISAGLTGQVLPDQFEAALFSRARGRAETEFAAAESNLAANYSKRGFFAPPGALMAGLHQGRLKGAEALANQATDIYVKRREMEVQHLQFVLGLASSQVQGLRGMAIQYAGAVANTQQQALSFAGQVCDMAVKLYDHLIARSNLAIAIMGALNSQYETRLKAALSALDGFKLQLETEKARKDVELAQVQIIEAKIKAQELGIRRYSAIIEAISRKAVVEELKLKGYSTRADVFKTQIQAQVAGFDIYKAALSGDQSKLDGELSKLKIYESQLQAIEMELSANIKSTESTVASNDAKIKIFQSQGDVYKLDAQAAIQKFSAYAEVKKLAQTIHGQELSNAIESFKANLEVPKIMLEALITEYKTRIDTLLKEADLRIQAIKIGESASEAAVAAYGGMASAALGSLNSMVSSISNADG
ncbi:MAG: hypothetical protein PHT88_04845 [Candidatus Moranbacteria bacterium]|nr:hypothetical protein [Candidatus Moranbacteria bacterium]